MTLDDVRRAAIPVCAQYAVKRLDLFGSLARGEQQPDSDVDLLVEFEEPRSDPARCYFGLLHHLEDVLGCRVDLLSAARLRNPHLRRTVLRDCVRIYGG